MYGLDHPAIVQLSFSSVNRLVSQYSSAISVAAAKAIVIMYTRRSCSRAKEYVGKSVQTA
jgi:hypothetical protein